MDYLKRIKEINTILETRATELEKCTEEKRMEEIRNETKGLIEERAELIVKERASITAGFAGGEIDTPEQRDAVIRENEERMVRDLVEKRSITLGALDILHISKDSNTLNNTFNQVSHMLDRINVVSAIGAEAYKKGYIKGYGTAGHTAEGGDATVSEPTWGYAEIKKTKITAYTEVPEEFEKMAASMYLKAIKDNLRISLKKKLALEIVVGTGESNRLTGILNSAASAIATAKDVTMADITNTSLDEIIYSFGGDEDVEEAVLYLNKLDLKKFAKLKDSDGRKLHKIDYKNKTIDGIPFEINSNITPYASADAEAYFMCYGTPSAYELALFSPVEVAKSDDYKFKEGMKCYKAVAFMGGNVTKYNGFVRFKKPAA